MFLLNSCVGVDTDNVSLVPGARSSRNRERSMPNVVNDIMREFVDETFERLDQLDNELVLLEHQPNDPDLVGRIFRRLQALTVTCGLFGFPQLASLTRAGEGVLERVRKGSVGMSPELTAILLTVVDASRQMVDSIEHTGQEGHADHEALRVALARLRDGQTAAPSLGEILLDKGHAAPADIAAAVREQQSGNRARVGEILVSRGAATEAAVLAALEVQSEVRHANAETKTVRVDVDVLEKLMTLVGDLARARDQITRIASAEENQGLKDASARLDAIAGGLQEGVRKTRRQRIGIVWSTLRRVARNLAYSDRRSIHIVMEGEETELHKDVIDAIKGPMTQLLRRAAEYAIESPSVRLALRKPSAGRLTMTATEDGESVRIAITDDGAGLDVAQLKANAIAAGAITSSSAATMSDAESLALIFRPGVLVERRGTPERGAGLDVVKADIERIGGTLEVTSTLGQGTTFTIHVPAPT